MVTQVHMNRVLPNLNQMVRAQISHVTEVTDTDLIQTSDNAHMDVFVITMTPSPTLSPIQTPMQLSD
jgi:hypothetical protein